MTILDAKCEDEFSFKPYESAAVAFIIPKGTGTITMYVKQASLSPALIFVIVLLVFLIVGGGIGYHFYRKKKNQ